MRKFGEFGEKHVFLLFRGIETAGSGRSQLCTPLIHFSLESPVLMVLFGFLAHIFSLNFFILFCFGCFQMSKQKPRILHNVAFTQDVLAQAMHLVSELLSFAMELQTIFVSPNRFVQVWVQVLRCWYSPMTHRLPYHLTF